VPSVAHVIRYPRDVKDLAVRRDILRFSKRVTQLALNHELSVDEVLDHIATDALALCGSAQGNDHLQSLKSALARVYSSLVAAQSGDNPLLPTAYPGLNQLIGGWRRGALHTIGASTGQGKTALCLNIATHSAQAGKTVLVFSLEMSGASLGERFLAAETGVSLVRLASGQIRGGDWAQVSDGITKLSEHRIWIDDTPGITIPTLRNQIKGFMLRHALDLVLVDYLQIARLGERVDKRYREVGLIAQSLKQIAREVDTPIIAAAQLSRAASRRDNNGPMLSDLGESSGIEQNSDIVLLIHRKQSGAPRQPATLKVAKNRYGPTGDVSVIWVPDKVSFVNVPASGK